MPKKAEEAMPAIPAPKPTLPRPPKTKIAVILYNTREVL
jgi:hypothetical protein